MRGQNWGLRIARAILLFATAFLALVQTEGMLFGIGDGDGKIGILAGILLATTGLGILVLTVAAFGALSRKIAFAHAGLIGGLLVLPMASLFTWGALRADIMSSHNQFLQTHIGLTQWIVDGIAVPLSLMAVLVSWSRIRLSPSEPSRT